MKRERSAAYALAWLKLPECISRREKERAFGVYRLLSHSFGNQAVSYQLEGDMLLAFGDQDAARDKYTKAAQLYQKQKEDIKAMAVYDHLFTLSGAQEYAENMLQIYRQLNQPVQAHVYMYHLCICMLRRQAYDQVIHLIDDLHMDQQHRAIFVMGMMYKVLADHLVSSAMKIKILGRSLDLVVHDVKLLSDFFSRLKAIDMHYYQEACTYVARYF